MSKTLNCMKRPSQALTEAEKKQVEEDFIEYCAIHAIDVTAYTANKASVKSFVDQLG